ncbi:GTP-binding protein HflX [Anseongella ginsenosidimutans]|uniref:GTPase HflX n=1 Tax=Anseongella ginsenosidimutans TaxID=496056 RepID=A0A4V6NZ20_9SPHI|nr:GTPase HflX [Anseongella ginsenosidimutans]QEC52013.1 GTPase HflX [Anseongella ginsenosidimutans]TCS85686.1 GTP-binding protein HflX [Anseongella ginsenosidimutans]
MKESGSKEKAVLVGVIRPEQSPEQAQEYLDELAFLVETAGGVTVKTFTQRLPVPDTKTFVGKGKLEEIQEYVKMAEADIVIFDDELSPSQTRNLENFLQVPIQDRSRVILDIFAKRAQTSQAKTQVDLARYEYILPRLTRMWTHLERQRGGTGTRGGAGEKEIETDRRAVRNRISVLKEKLSKIEKQNATQRKNRGELVRVALVGYTNVGKSTLMNLLSKSSIFAENKLFATLDTTVRKVVFHNLPFLLSDTVGFIRKLPHHLVESFKSTLEETREADILIHVVDISHPNFDDHIRTVNETLKELGAGDKLTITVFNKIDLYNAGETGLNLDEFKRTWMAKENAPAVFISATGRENIEELRDLIYEKAKAIHLSRYPHDGLLYPDLPEKE